MLAVFRPLTEKHLDPKLFGKFKKYRLTRGRGLVNVTGRLLALYRQAQGEPLPPNLGSMDTLAVIQTARGRLLVYYIVAHPQADQIVVRHEYLRLCPDFAAVREFLSAMVYPNRDRFLEDVLAEAKTRLERN